MQIKRKKYLKAPLSFLARFSLSLSLVCVCVIAKTGYRFIPLSVEETNREFIVLIVDRVDFFYTRETRTTRTRSCSIIVFSSYEL